MASGKGGANGGGKLPLSTVLAYGLPGLPMAVLLLPLYIYLPPFYAETVGAGYAAVGAVLFFARLWDMITDPVIGIVSDRLRSRFGRRRPVIAAGIPVLLLSAVLLFNPPDGLTPGWAALWLLLGNLGLYLGGTMILVPYSAWGAELTPDFDERTRVAGAREGFVMLGTLVASGVPFLLATSPGETLRLIGWGLCLVVPAVWLVAFARVPDARHDTPSSLGLREGLAAMRRNPAFGRLLLAYLVNGTANGLPATLFILFVSNVLVAPDWWGTLLFVYFLCGLVAVPFWLWLSARTGKKAAWIASMLWASAVFAFVPFLGEGDVWPFMAVCVLSGFSLGADLALPASMQADVVDVDTARTGERRAGTFFAAWGMATKLALALAVGIAFPVLGTVGFSDGGDNPPAALATLAGLYAAGPVVLKLIAIWIVRGYALDKDALAAARSGEG